MSQEFSDKEIFSDFVIEAKEHLETIEPNLLELEKNPGNLALLNEIFRPMHSLKGASGFLGLPIINRLAHKAENVLDELRTGAMCVTSEIMDIILGATDSLTQLINNLEAIGEEGEVDVSAITASLEGLLANKGAAGAAPPSGASGENVCLEPAPEPAKEKKNGNGQPAPEPYTLTILGDGHLNDFLDEAVEIVESLNASLVGLEKAPEAGSELVNDVFRYFHNLKGNSGIVGYKELNALTHEAETLLNKVRKGEMACSREMIDLLLYVVDAVETLLTRVDPETGRVIPMDIYDHVYRLQKALTGEFINGGPPMSAGALEVVGEAGSMAPASQAAPAGAPEDSGPEAVDVEIFKETTALQVANMAIALAKLREDSEQSDCVDGLHRSLTTLQNSAGYMGLEALKEYADRTATLVDQGRNSGVGFELLLDILEQECAILTDMVEKEVSALDAALTAAQEASPETSQDAGTPVASSATATEAKASGEKEAPTPQAPGQPSASTGAGKPAKAEGGDLGVPQKAKISTTIRVDHEKLDHLMNLIGELIINRNRFSMLGKKLEAEQNTDLTAIAQDLIETTDSMARISDDLQDTIMNVRMVPVSTVFSRFPRLVRDLSRKSGKDVELLMEGEETELDKSVVEVIGDPLVHLIRNSMDHGIESDEERAKLGKGKGRVWLRAYHKGNSVAIEVEDDGKGIDPEKMREVAIRKGVITPEEAKALDDHEARELIFAPGFSSAEQVTDISGRGVGMDVVRTNIKSLKGSVNIASEVGKGSTFTLTLPLTLAIIDALMVKVAGQTFAIPLDAVSETTKIRSDILSEVNGRKAVTLRDEVLGIVPLSELLGFPGNDKEEEILSVVVVHDNQRRLGLAVDMLLERQEIVIKPLGEYLGDRKGLSGATIMGDGGVILILDPHEIYMMATSKAI